MKIDFDLESYIDAALKDFNPGRSVGGPREESQDAAELIDVSPAVRNEMYRDILRHLATQGWGNDGGDHCDGTEAGTGLIHATCSARFNELHSRPGGVLVSRDNPETGKPYRRPTRSKAPSTARVFWIALNPAPFINFEDK